MQGTEEETMDRHPFARIDPALLSTISAQVDAAVGDP
jgi:hypothetical protein